MTTKLSMVLAMVLMTGAAWGQGVNKCPGPNGKPIYQQMPCSPQGGGEKLNIPTPKMDSVRRIEMKLSGKPVDVRNATPEEVQKCLSLLKIVNKYKDPESIRVEGDAYFSTYASGNSTVSMDVNGKNSYGAYAGAKRHTCLFDEKGMIDEVF